VSEGEPAGLVERIRAEVGGDVHLVGGPSTIQAFLELGALDRLGLLVLPILIGGGLPLTPPGIDQLSLRLESEHTFPDGAVELVYSPAS
jgi:dihydrofolate reductase